MSVDIESNNEKEDNYYTYLNVSRDATTDEIIAAYRKLSRIFHPDKHVDPEKKQKAEIFFNRTKHAYEILSDPKKRAIYDSVGERGLQADGWELIHRTQTAAEIREEYERLANAAEERKLQQRTNPRGVVTININATEFFSPYDEDDSPRIEVSSMSMSQSIEAPITRKDTITMSGNLYSSNGNGSGNFVLCGRRLLNKGWIEPYIGAGSGPVLGIKGGRTFSMVTVNGGTSVNFRESGGVLAFFSSLAIQLDRHTVGSLTLNAGTHTSLATQIDGSKDQNTWTTSFVIGVPHSYFSAAYSRKIADHDLKVNLAAKIGTFGFTAEYGAEKKVSKYSSVFASISIGVPSGVVLKMKISRSNQSYVFPIHLSEEIVPAVIFYGTVSPILVWFFVKKTIIEPIIEERKNFERAKTEKKNEQRMASKKNEALAAIDLMYHTYERIVSEETNRNGLLVIKATYGKTEEDGVTLVANASIDVTIPLQCLVKEGVLQLYNSSKSDLPGFYDPCIGENKMLKIEYSYHNQRKEIFIKDEESVRLPPFDMN